MTEALLAAVYTQVLPIRSFLGLPDVDGSSALHAVIVATRRGPLHPATAAPPEAYVRRKIHGVCDDAIRALLRLGVRTVLTKGWRLDHGDTLINFSGSTHRDQLTTRDWAGLLGEIGAPRLFQLLVNLNICLFRRLSSSCYLQLTGLPFDDEVRLALRSPLLLVLPDAAGALSEAAPLGGSRASAGECIELSCMRGAWVLPRSDARVPSANRGFGLRYCRPLFYAGSPRAARPRHGLPIGHALNIPRPSPPLGGGVESLPGSSRTLPPTAMPSAATGLAADVLTTGPTAAPPRSGVCLLPTTRNAARRLIHHIFVDRPHVIDVAVYNGAAAAQQQLWGGAVQTTTLPAAATTTPGAPAAAAAMRRTQSRQTESCAAASVPLTAPLNSVPLPEIDSRRKHAADDTRIPAALLGLIPVFLQMFHRLSRCRYTALLNARCPRSDVVTSPETPTAEVAAPGAPVARQAGMKRGLLIEGEARAEQPDDKCGSGLGLFKRRRLDVPVNHADTATRASEQAQLGRLSPPLPLLPAEQCAAAPLQHVTPHAAVMAYVRDCLGRVLPPALWGGADNRRHILRLVWIWITAGKRDRLPVTLLLDGCRVSGFAPVLGSTTSGAGASRSTTSAVQTWISWLLLGFVTPLLRSSFYVTDSEIFHHRPLYFRREVWERLSSATVFALRQTLKLMPLDPAGAVAAVGSSSLGVAGMRLSPKRGALRPIMNLAATHVGAALLERARRGVAKDAALGGPSLGSASAVGDTSGGGVAGDSTAGAARAWLQASAAAPVRSVNKQLEAVFEVLKLARRRAPGAMGAAVFGLDGIYASFRRFVAVRGMRALTAATAARAAAAARVPDSISPGTASAAPSAPLYMFCCDVASAYDSIVQSIAYGHVEELLPRDVERYEVRAYTEVSASGWAVVLPGGSRGTAAELQRTVISAARTRFRRVAVACDGGLAPFHRQVGALASESHNTVFVDGSFSESVTREQCLESVRKIVWHHHVASPDGRIWRQTRGVPQGSIVSSFLCNAYLGGMERRELVPGLARVLNLQRQQERSQQLHRGEGSVRSDEGVPSDQCASLLMRLTDDMFLVTEDAAVAAAVQGLLCAGVPRYAVVINPAKTQASFEVVGGQDAHAVWAPGACVELPAGESRVPLPRVRPLADAQPLSWCGLLLYPATGAVLSDYSRYLGPGGLVDSLAIGFGPTPGEAVTRMMRSFLRPKCHPVLLDGHINSLGTVALNVFQLSLIAAAKLVVVLRRLGQIGGGSASSTHPRLAALALRTSLDAADYVVALVRRRCPGRLADVLREGSAAASGGGCAAPPCGPASGPADARRGRVLLLGPSSAWSLDDATEMRQPANDAGEAEASGTGAEAAASAAPPPSPAWCPLRNAEVRWLALSAFARAFTRAHWQEGFRGVHAALLRARLQGGGEAAGAPLGGAGAAAATVGSAEGSTQPLSSAPADAAGHAAGDVCGDRRAGAPAAPAPPPRVRLSVRCAADPDLTPWLEELDF